MFNPISKVVGYDIIEASNDQIIPVSELTDISHIEDRANPRDERSLLTKGPAFCPTPKDVNWQKVIDDLDKFERRICLAFFHHGRNPDENPRKVDDRLPAIPSATNWMPPKCSSPEVEVFINNVRKDILEPQNLRTVKDNLTKDERLALRNLKSSDKVIRIQDNSRTRLRRFRRTSQTSNRAPTRDENDVVARPDINLPDLNSINLTSSELTDAERSLLTKGPAFCPTPKDVNCQKLPIGSPEVEVFINNVRKDILEPQNLRTVKDNLTKEERLALRNLKSSDKVIRIQDKGSRFVILNQEEYQDKMLGQLNNNLHYNKVNSDPTPEHFEKVKNWGRKWLGEGQISQEIATWVTNLEPKPGVAFGNVKTHKEANPLRLITSCCGTSIERLSAFTEFYLKPLAQNLPSFVKDTSDLINKIQALNAEKGPLPPGSLLVSWDVVAMFPNIDNNLGISAVRNALDSRKDKFPSTDCIVEAVEICLQINNCQFADQNFIQKHGTAMGPKNACSYADLAMGLIDEKAKLGGASKPMLWWRYRDDVFDLWTLGLTKLLEFTEYINSLYPTIKFELVYSESSLNVLDLTLHLQDGFIITDIYAKPTDSHLYLPFSSSHPSHCMRAIPYGVALRIKRNCSTDQFLNKRCEEYKGYLCSQNYSKELVDRQFEKALSNERSELLTKRVKPKKKVFPLVLDYNPILPDIQQDYISKRDLCVLVVLSRIVLKRYHD
ncbi:uncharacterized protein [Montipora foliosa]|uniref:uncharacterized protein n=1 Tax=Montipora foliosa TaxID=591990 RepID=UPI0035F1B9D8